MPGQSTWGVYPSFRGQKSESDPQPKRRSEELMRREAPSGKERGDKGTRGRNPEKNAERPNHPLAVTADPGTATSLQMETKQRVEAEVRSYLQSLCPSQCELSEVSVKVAPRKPAAGTTPGFEDLSLIHI